MARSRRAAAPSAWERRNARARQAGYLNYYDYRAHGYGAKPPAAPRAKGPELARLRGHASLADLNKLISRGQVELVKVNPGERNPKTGTWKSGDLIVTLSDGSERTFRLRGAQLSRAKMRLLRDRFADSGAMVLDSPSLDLFGRFEVEGPQGPRR